MSQASSPSRTCRSRGLGFALPSELPALAPALLQEHDVRDDHLPVDGLAHVVDGQGCHGGCGEGLHLNAGLTREFDGSDNADAGPGLVDREIDAYRTEVEGM